MENNSAAAKPQPSGATTPATPQPQTTPMTSAANSTGPGPLSTNALSATTALNALPGALAHIGLTSAQTTAAAATAKRPRIADRQLPLDLDHTVPESRLLTDLQAFERNLDATILRKRLEFQEAKGAIGSGSTQRTLRIFVSNTVANQAHQMDEDSLTAPAGGANDSLTSPHPAADTTTKSTQPIDPDSLPVPSWTLKIEGRLLDMPYAKKTTQTCKFTSFFDSVVVELLRDPRNYPSANANQPPGESNPSGAEGGEPSDEKRQSQITEWKRTEDQANVDGFEVKRCGDVDVPVRIILTPRSPTDRFQLSQDLASVLALVDPVMPSPPATGANSDAAAGKRASRVAMSRIQVITQLWHYIRHHKLQSPADPQRIIGDDALQRLFGVKEWSFPLVSHLLRPHLLPPEPVVIEYTVRVNPDAGDSTTGTGQQYVSPLVYDLQVEVDDLVRSRAYGYHKSATVHHQIAHLDDQLTTVIRNIQNAQQKRAFLTQFSQDPAQFIHRWVESQARELDAISQERSDLTEVARRANYFHESWVDEAVQYYLGTQTSSTLRS
ncbi:SWI/SNF and RSC complex subunit Ssr3 [Dimargaris cristalligena]|nr:SWI/SNF and RSC complex subunit Ssr3 [Dimargaris cristalligena]